LEAAIPPAAERAIVTVCQEITNPENVGTLIRVSAAFGARAMVLGERCCDPFFRQSIRVSMGTIFALPIIRSQNLLRDLDELADRGGFERLAAVLSVDAQPLRDVRPPARAAVVFGSEAQGLDPATIRHCDRKVTIPMRRGTDSLNVAIAAAVFLYQLTADEQ
jgi:tRNA G18 (ribose-2'-O)-methylase SpoU